MDLIYIGSRKRLDILSKLGAWGPWERIESVEGEGRRRGAEEKVQLSKINKKVKNNKNYKIEEERRNRPKGGNFLQINGYDKGLIWEDINNKSITKLWNGKKSEQIFR